MKIGCMNFPALSLEKEIKFAARNRFDFIDLTLEPPEADPEQIDTKKIKRLLKEYCIGVIGHTAFWLPYADSFYELREASLKILKKCLMIFKKLGARKVNIHVYRSQKVLGNKKIVALHVTFLHKIVNIGKRYGIKIILEHFEPDMDIKQFSKIIKTIPELGVHLDMGHANINKKIKKYIKKFSKRIEHVHISDNYGKQDEHLAIGKGNINWKRTIKMLKNTGYDGTITLEIFAPKPFKKYLLKSKKKLQNLWKKC